MIPDDIELRRITPEDVPCFARVMNTLIDERRWLGATRPRTLDDLHSFVKELERLGAPQLLALDTRETIGWCDIMPGSNEATAHVGRLGMGMAAHARRRGVGAALLDGCLEQATRFGLEKVELDVYHDNAAAIALYRAHGFHDEGRRRRARKLDGQYQDVLQMAWFPMTADTIRDTAIKSLGARTGAPPRPARVPDRLDPPSDGSGRPAPGPARPAS